MGPEYPLEVLDETMGERIQQSGSEENQRIKDRRSIAKVEASPHKEADYRSR
jgi:hypothetical protein